MINLLRQNQRVMMLAIAIITIVSFIWLYNSAEITDLSKSGVAFLYGHSLTRDDIAREAKNYKLALALGQTDLLMSLAGQSPDQDSASLDFVWNLLVLRHESDQLGINPTDAQIEARFLSLPVFQTNGQFDSRKYSDFIQNQLTPRGLSKKQLDSIMRDSLKMEKIKQVVGSTVTINSAEMRQASRVNQKITGAFVRFDLATALAATKVPPEDIAGYFERNKLRLMAPETRVVRFAVFELPKAGPELTGRDRIDALQKLANKTSDFVQSLTDKSETDFATSAAKAGATVKTTAAFAKDGTAVAPAAAGEVDDAEILAGMAAPAFALSDENRTSEVVQIEDDFYVLELSAVTKARPLTLAEASPDIEETLRNQMAQLSMKQSGVAAIKAIRAGMAGGSSFADAAKKEGLKVEKIDSLSLMTETLAPELQQVLAATIQMTEGELSGYEKSETGGFAVWLQSRSPLDEAEYAIREPKLAANAIKNKEAVLFAEWLRVAREKADFHWADRK